MIIKYNLNNVKNNINKKEIKIYKNFSLFD